MSGSREAILRAATRLFAERGYAAVSVRDIAAAAEVSPALVIKLGGSKHELFRASVAFTGEDLDLDVPDHQLAEVLTARVVDRAVGAAPEPLVRAVVLLMPAPDPDVVREAFTAAYLEPLTARLGGDESARGRSELAIAALVGLAVSVRMFHSPDLDSGGDEVTRRYAAAIDALLWAPQR